MAKSNTGKRSSVKEALRSKDEELTGSYSLMGINALTVPQYNNSMRTVMFNGHTKQFKNMIKPEFPRVFTGAEDLVGKYSSGYKKTKTKLSVYKKIEKEGPNEDAAPLYYHLFLYDKKKDEYSVIERKPTEVLGENFGYNFNNAEIDKYDEGDTIPKDTVLVKSTSYDDDMHYSYGVNVPYMNVLDSYSSEDACIVSDWLAARCTTVKNDVVEISLNSNEVACNLYGDDDEYRPLPGLREDVRGILLGKKTIYNNQVLSDFSDMALREVNYNRSDSCYYAKGTVVDVTIYCNNEDIEDTPFNHQLLDYYDKQNRYWKEVRKVCKEIISSASSYTHEIEYLYKRSKEMLDPDTKWVVNDSPFSNIIIHITVMREEPLRIGQKACGRYGNKWVISDVRPLRKMPRLSNGKYVHLLVSALGIVNRTTGFPLMENSINFICGRFREVMSEKSTFAEKEELAFKCIKGINNEQFGRIKPDYEKKTKEEKEEYIRNIERDGFFIHQNPMWDEEYVFYRIANMYALYPDILTPYDVYIRKFGREVKTLNTAYVGEQYVMFLKQDSKRGHSARATGSINSKGLPDRSYRNKSKQDHISTTPIRFGEFENLNFKIGMMSDDIALFHAMYRTSIQGREDLSKQIMDPEGEIEIADSYTNRVAEIFSVIIKSLSIELSFQDSKNVIKTYDDKSFGLHTFDGETHMCTEWDIYRMERKKEMEEEVFKEKPIIEEEELKEALVQMDKESDVLIGPVMDENIN